MSDIKRVLFVCVENSNRSQMAEAFARKHGGQAVEAYSAGSQPSGVVNPKAIEAMSECDYDLTTHHSKSLNDLPQVTFDRVVTMGCGDKCPQISALTMEDWPLPDPKHLPEDGYRIVRNTISERVQVMLADLGVAV